MKQRIVPLFFLGIVAIFCARFLCGKLAEFVSVAKYKKKHGITEPVPHMEDPKSSEEAEDILASPAVDDLTEFSLCYSQIHLVSLSSAATLIMCLLFNAVFMTDIVKSGSLLFLMIPGIMIAFQIVICVAGCNSMAREARKGMMLMRVPSGDAEWIEAATGFVRKYNLFVDMLNAHS